MKKKQSEYERFMALTPAQRRRETEAFETEDLSPGKPLTPRERKEFERIIRRESEGRPNEENIRISVDRGLLTRADRLARRRHMNRSQVFEEGLRNLLKAG
jgi:hypothetical protein